MKKNISIGEIVAHDYRAASVFKDAGIDFCCGGKKSILPPDSSNTYKVSFTLLEQFEDDLHTHVHLENNILFPKALKQVSIY